MNLDDIKSPLPPRNFQSEVNKDDEAETIKEEGGGETESNTPLERVSVPTASSQTPETKKTKKGLLVGLMIGIIIILIGYIGYNLIGSLIGGGPVANEVTINYWGLWEDPSIVEGVIADFESQNPGIKINYKKNTRTDYRSRLKGRLSKEAADEEVPDIFRIHNSWIPMFEENLETVPDATVAKIGLDEDFYDAYKRDIAESGKYWGVPLMYDGLALFYNKELLDNAQISVPRSWWGLREAANKLTVKDENGNIKVAGVALGLTDNVDQWSDIVGLMMKQNGVDLVGNQDPNNWVKLKDVLAFYTQFRTDNPVWDETLPGSTEHFANGKLGFYFGPSWRAFNIEEMNPNLKFEITSVPQLPTLDTVAADQAENEAELTNIHWSTYWIEGVNRNSKHKKEAWKFLEFLASRESLEKMHQTASQVRSFGEIYPRKSMMDLMLTNTKTKTFVENANYASNWYLSSRTFDVGLNDEMSKYFGDAINTLVNKRGEDAAAMKTLESGIKQMIQKYQLKK